MPWNSCAQPAVQEALAGRNRWGDFSITTVDPSDDTTMWTIQEYTSGANKFGTWWAKLTVVKWTPRLEKHGL